MRNLLKSLSADLRGATAIEYGLIAAFISLAMVVALPGIKSSLSATFSEIEATLSS